MNADSELRVLQDVGRIVRDARRLLRVTQTELERRARVSQSRISRIERGRCSTLRLTEIDRLFVALGVRYRLDARLPAGIPYLNDAVHVRCATYVQRRLEAEGWLVRREVEIGGDRGRGWIDVLAFHPGAQILLVIEVKTELSDIGAVERSLNWYQHEAWQAASRFGWRPARMASSLLVLATTANDHTIRLNRSAFEVAFGGRATALRALVAGAAFDARRTIAMIDPRSRRHDWLMALKVDGRRSAAPYADYLDAVRILEGGRR